MIWYQRGWRSYVTDLLLRPLVEPSGLGTDIPDNRTHSSKQFPQNYNKEQ